MDSQIQNQLGTIRRARGIAAAELARRVGVSRQTIHSIEAGAFVPNTEVALKLARELKVAVEELFALPHDHPAESGRVASDLLSGTAVAAGAPVRVAEVNGRLLSVPVNAAPYYLPEADGVLSGEGAGPGEVELAMFAGDERVEKKLVLAGCDPAVGMLARMVERVSGVEVIPAAASSRLALRWLKEGKVHVAGSHLEDPETGEFNLPYLRREFPGEDFAVVTFARWEEGWVTAPGNPLRIRKTEDLARTGVRFVNRELGSGSRGLLDRLLASAGLAAAVVHGYENVAQGHLVAAYSVSEGVADCCLATRSAARAYGLDFVPLRAERYDLVMRRATLALPAAAAFLDLLQRASLRNKLEVLAGYDTSGTGAVLA